MLGLNHTLSGGILALALPAPIAVPAAFISHFVLDAMPHFGDHPKFKSSTPQLRALIVTDGILSVSAMILMMTVRPDKWLLITLCCFFAVIPDLFWIFQKQLKNTAMDTAFLLMDSMGRTSLWLGIRRPILNIGRVHFYVTHTVTLFCIVTAIFCYTD